MLPGIVIVRSSSFIWFLPVLQGSSCCLTFFSISSIFLNGSGVVLDLELQIWLVEGAQTTIFDSY